jgi:hypothetical protein
MAVFSQLEPDARLVCFNKRKKTLCDWLPAVVVRIVEPIEFRETPFVILRHDGFDCFRGQV